MNCTVPRNYFQVQINCGVLSQNILEVSDIERNLKMTKIGKIKGCKKEHKISSTIHKNLSQILVISYAQLASKLR